MTDNVFTQQIFTVGMFSNTVNTIFLRFYSREIAASDERFR